MKRDIGAVDRGGRVDTVEDTERREVMQSYYAEADEDVLRLGGSDHGKLVSGICPALRSSCRGMSCKGS
jgi:hypothetical protein